MAAGPLPWDGMSSSEDEYSPRQRTHSTVQDCQEEEQEAARTEANGSAVHKAPAPEATEAADQESKSMSLADQIAHGKKIAKTATGLFQVSSLSDMPHDQQQAKLSASHCADSAWCC